jgi:hypothetical protein
MASDDEKRILSRSEKFRNYLIGLGAISALILGVVAQFKGEPKAEETWTVLRANQNRQAKELNRIRMRLHYFQAYQEARTAMKLQGRLDELQERYDALLTRKKTEKMTAVTPSDCREGWVRGTDGKCHRVRRPVAKAVKTVKRKLAEETVRRFAAERKKRELLKKIRAQTSQKMADLPALPEKLEDATKEKK